MGRVAMYMFWPKGLLGWHNCARGVWAHRCQAAELAGTPMGYGEWSLFKHLKANKDYGTVSVRLRFAAPCPLGISLLLLPEGISLLRLLCHGIEELEEIVH